MPFVKGDPNINREGRPKGSVSVVQAIKKKLEEVPEGKTKTYLEYLTDQVFKKAVVEGDVSMIKDIIDRVDGKAKQPLIGGDEDDPAIKTISQINYIVPNGNNSTPNPETTRSVSSAE